MTPQAQAGNGLCFFYAQSFHLCLIVGGREIFRIMPLFLRFLAVSVDLVLSLTPDLTLNWVIAMKQDKTLPTLAALFLTVHIFTASAVSGTDLIGRSPGFSGHVSDPPGFGGYLGDNASPGPWPPAPHMKDSSADKSPAGGCCYGFGCQEEYTRIWAGVDYMMMWSKGRYLPPLVTTDPTLGVPPLSPAMILFGGEDVGQGVRSAGRFSLGLWLDECEQIGVGGRFLISQTDEVSFGRATGIGGLPVLARPFFDASTATLNAVMVATPFPPTPGSVADRATNDLMNLDAYLKVLFYEYDRRRLDLLVGYQYSEIRDELNLWSASDGFTYGDDFNASNTFHGVGLGLHGEYRYGGLTFSALGKLGLGNMHRKVRIDGNNTEIPPRLAPGGFFALEPSMGTYQDDEFSVAPEVEVKVLYEISKGLEVSLGYSFLYWTNVALAGDQMDTFDFGGNVWARSDGDKILGLPGSPLFPAFTGIHDAGFWAQGLTFGVTFKR